MRRLLIALVAAAVAATTACQPVLLAPAKPVQVDASTAFEGDSLSLQFAMSGGGDYFPGAVIHAGNGWAMTACLPAGCTTPLEDVRQRTADGQADRVVWLLGTNDAVDGFSTEEANGWATALFAAADTACVVLVKPYITDPQPAEFKAGVDKVRSWIDATAPLRPNTVVVDWAPYAQRPGVLWFDGVHLQPIDPTDLAHVTDAAVEARRDVIADGLAGCV